MYSTIVIRCKVIYKAVGAAAAAAAAVAAAAAAANHYCLKTLNS